jgi:hypothetical protein
MDVQPQPTVPTEVPIGSSDSDLSSHEERTQKINTLMQKASLVVHVIGEGLSRIGREIAMMILKR